jgi:amino acid adenylation domain-containing protein
MNAQNLLGQLYRLGAVVSVEDGDLLIDAPDDVLDDALIAAIRQNKAAMIAMLNTLNALDAKTALAAAKGEYPAAYEFPASMAQQRMLFMEELAGRNSYYNIPVAYEIRGALNRAALDCALQQLLAAHDVLRTTYLMRAGACIQRIGAPQPMPINWHDLSQDTDQAKALAELLQLEANHLFDLQHEWPIRLSLIRLSDQAHVLSINIHHIAADGWSAGTILRDLGAAYQRACDAQGRAVATTPGERAYQYADYVSWQTAWMKSGDCQAAKDYWRAQLQGAPELHGLPLDFRRPNVQAVAGHTLVTSLSAVAALESTARAYRTTPFVVLQSVFAALLARYSGEIDIVFGTAAANRQPLAFVDTVGLFVNTLPLRYAVQDETTFAQLLAQAVTVTEGAFRHQQFPFDELVDLLQPARSLGYNPLLQIMLVMQEDKAAGFALDGLEVIPLAQRQAVAKFDLALHVYPAKDQWRCHWEYNTALFASDTIAAMALHFDTLLAACMAQPDQATAAFDLLTPALAVPAAPPVLDTVLQARQHFPAPVAIHRLFEARVALAPDALAVREGEHALSYFALNQWADQVARQLVASGCGNGDRIGVCMEKSTQLVVGMLAIFKIGAIYVPLDPYYPRERLDWMMHDTGMAVLLTSAHTTLPAGLDAGTRVVSIDAPAQGAENSGAPFASAAPDVGSPAYIIYTSGSTGKPKGVLVSHQALCYSLHANRELMGITDQDVMPTIGSQAFGVSLLEILLPLMSGGEVAILRKAKIADLASLIAHTQQVTVLHAVPSLMQQWLDAVMAAGQQNLYPRLRLLLVGGEAVPDSLLKAILAWRPGIRLLELYGMTEAAIVCSSFVPATDAAAHYCIGKPHATTRFHVLNRMGQQQPQGVPGELHIGGLSIANGYVNQPEITAEKFIASPFAPGERLYKTGDRVRCLADGNHEFLGRVDHQVSLRGARIELGEIEMLAAAVAGVKQAVAHVAELGQDEKTLVLYYTAKASQDDAGAALALDLAQAIREHLTRYLPDYMRPSLIQRLDAFPLNPNGKVDRKHLPAPRLDEVQVAPANETEQRLATLWCEVLQCDAVGVTADFFAVGGHSLMATKLAGRIRAVFEIDLPLSVMFAAPSIRACAAHIEAALRDKYAASLLLQAGEESADGDELII